MQEPERADFLEAFGEDVLEKALDEGQGIQGHGFPGLMAGFRAEGHGAVLHADEPPVGQGHPVDVGGQVLQGRATVADSLAVDDPRCGPGVRGDLGKQVGGRGLESVSKLCPKDLT